jgi:hypothetical protein
MNKHAVEALREAMEAPSWWTNRARLSAREVLERLEAQGYRLASITGSTALESVAAEPDGPDLRAPEDATAREAAAHDERAAPPRTGLSRLMGELDSRVADARRDTDTEAEPHDEASRRSA